MSAFVKLYLCVFQSFLHKKLSVFLSFLMHYDADVSTRGLKITELSFREHSYQKTSFKVWE